MSVQHQANGSLRLACDGDWCDRKFSPKKKAADVRALRWRATDYGWLTQPDTKKQPSIPGIDTAAADKVRDICPECRRRA